MQKKKISAQSWLSIGAIVLVYVLAFVLDHIPGVSGMFIKKQLRRI